MSNKLMIDSTRQTALNVENKNSGSSVAHIIGELMIENLAQTYQKSHPQPNKCSKSNFSAQMIQESVQRLSQKKQHQMPQPAEDENPHTDIFYSSLYPKESSYKEEFAKKKLMKQITQIRGKLIKHCQYGSPKIDFEQSLIKFLMSSKNINEFQHKYQSQRNSDSAFADDFLSFYKSLKTESTAASTQIGNFQVSDLFDRAKMLAFTSFVFRLGEYVKLSREEANEIFESNSSRSELLNLCQWVKEGNAQQSEVDQKSQLNQQYVIDNFVGEMIQRNKITIPYQSSLYDFNKDSVSAVQSEPKIKKSKPFHHKPIPSTTYTAQKFESPAQKHTTEAQPFSFSRQPHKKTDIDAEQLYNWNRQFKAKPVPKCIYERNYPSEQCTNQNQRAIKLLKKASYPSGMKDLEDYPSYLKSKQNELENKYYKNYGEAVSKVKAVPNFEEQHKTQMIQLQAHKTQNKASTTTPKPFNFSTKRQKSLRVQIEPSMIATQPQTTKKRPKSSLLEISSACKSTMKFDTYVQKRKNEKELKKEQQAALEEKKRKKNENMAVYRDILKQRMSQGYDAKKGIKLENCKVPENSFKVDLESIYRERPLLVTGQNVKANAKGHLNFSDTYTPVI